MSMKRTSLTLALIASFAAANGFAQTTGTTSASNTTTATTTASTAPTSSPASASNPTTKLTSKFSQWAGSTENATALVEGLRSGKSITLTSGTSTSTGTTSGTSGSISGTNSSTSGSTTFTPPTKPMGYGNIKIALSLAQTQLAQQGITQPTPQQMQTALMGGQLNTGTGSSAQTSTMQGVLQMRADGMGWGKIANTMGVKLGAVMSGKANVAPTGSGTTTAGGTTATTAAKGQGNSAKGITTAGGTSAAATGKAHTKSGIVTAAGGAGGNAMAGGAGKGGQSAGVVSAAGGNVGNAGGNGNHGKSGK